MRALSRIPTLFGFFLLAGLLFLSSPGLAREGKFPVAASILPLADFCRQIGGDRVAVQVLIPPGASPHVFEPTPGAVAQAMAARVFVFVGAGLDPWSARLLKSRSPGQEVVEAVAGLKLIQDVAPLEVKPPQGKESSRHHPGHHQGEEDQAHKHHHHPGGNPHVWLDPVLAKDICRRISQAFIRIDPEHQKVYEENLARYLARLEDLNQEVIKTVAGFKLRDFVSFHPAFTYFARRYGLQEVGVIEAAPGREPSPRHLQKIIAAIKSRGVRAVFAEPQLSPRMAEVIAREAGVKVLLLDPLGGRPPYGQDYLQLMRHNLAVMTEALQ